MSWKVRALEDLVENFSVRAKDYGGADGLDFLGVSNEDGITKSKYAAEEKAEDYKIIEKGCFAYNPYRINVGSIAYLAGDERGLISPAYVVFKTKENTVEPELLLKFLKSSEGLRQIKLHARGTVRQALRFEDLCKIEINLPDYKEQKPLITKLNSVQGQSENLATELTHQHNLLTQLRQSFLREAMQGKLVKQDPKDGNAKQLLEKIKAEKEKLIVEKKIKKDKPLPAITEDDIPFDIPENWTWCRLGEIALYSEAGTSFKAEEVPADKNEWAVIKTSAITSGCFIENENKKLPNQKMNLDSIRVKTGDIIFCRASGSKGLAGKSCLIEKEPNAKLVLSDKSIRFAFSLGISTKYIQFYNSSLLAEAYYNKLGTGKSTSMNNITREQFNNLPIPLPPLPEQNQIVKRLDELMKICDGLLESIQASREQNELLLQQVLKEALQK